MWLKPGLCLFADPLKELSLFILYLFLFSSLPRGSMHMVDCSQSVVTNCRAHVPLLMVKFTSLGLKRTFRTHRHQLLFLCFFAKNLWPFAKVLFVRRKKCPCSWEPKYWDGLLEHAAAFLLAHDRLLLQIDSLLEPVEETNLCQLLY